MSSFACGHCGADICDSLNGYVTGCAHYPLEGSEEWRPMETDAPDFREHGFHTGKKVQVRRIDGTEEVTIYQGYGLFGNGVSMFSHATHWRPNVQGQGDGQA